MSTLEILNEALINYTTTVRTNVSEKADTVDILRIISNSSNELKDMINRKADIDLLSSLISGNTAEFLALLDIVQNDINNRVLISQYNADNILSNLRFESIESTKADEFNSTLSGLTSAQRIHTSGDIRTEGTLYASNLHILGDTSIVNTVTTVTDQLTITNSGTDVAFIVTQNGTTNIAEFYNSENRSTIIDNFGRVGINTVPRYDLDVAGTIFGTTIYGEVSKTTVNNVFIEDIFSSNLTLIDELRSYVDNTVFIVESNIKIITNTINYGRDQLLNNTANISLENGGDYLPIIGGTVTGDISVEGNTTITGTLAVGNIADVESLMNGIVTSSTDISSLINRLARLEGFLTGCATVGVFSYNGAGLVTTGAVQIYSMPTISATGGAIGPPFTINGGVFTIFYSCYMETKTAFTVSRDGSVVGETINVSLVKNDLTVLTIASVPGTIGSSGGEFNYKYRDFYAVGDQFKVVTSGAGGTIDTTSKLNFVLKACQLPLQ